MKMVNFVGALALVCLAASADAVRMNDGIPKLPGIKDKIAAINNRKNEEISLRTFDKKEKTATTP